MAADRQKREEVIFKAALQREDRAARDTYVAEVCGDDAPLLAGVQTLLHYHDLTSFLDVPVLGSEIDVDAPPVTEGPGVVIDRYKLLEKIGEGGMAVVYMAEQQTPIRRKVALKIIKLGMDTKQVIARFEAERQALAMMDHTNIAKVFDGGVTETGRPYFVMELVTGVSITKYCDRNHLSTRERLALFIQVGDAVQYSHQKGIIHRDLKPSNVMVTVHDGKPVPKVIDFGIAKATKQRLTEKTFFTRYAQIIGTPAYMSPEQAELSDVDIDTRSDIYSLGVLLYELLTGTTPFSEEKLRRAGFLEMNRVIREEVPAKPSTKLSTLGATLAEVAQRREVTPGTLRRLIRGDLDWIVMKSLEKDRTRRYDTVSTLLADIERHLHHEPVSASPPSAWYRMKKFVERRRTLVAATVAVVIAVVMSLVVSIAMYVQAERARAETQTVVDFLTNDLLASVYPEKAKGQEVTVRYVLDNASMDLDKKFENSPLAQAKVREALGLTYQKMGDYEAAEPHLERALKVRRQLLGKDDPATLASLDGLGWLYWYQGRNEEAEPLLVEAFEARQRVLGLEHPDTLESMTHLAWLGVNQARDTEKMDLPEKAYEIGRRVLGEEHPTTLSAVTALAMRYVMHFQHAEAKAIAPQAYEISRRALGEEHETTLVLMNVLTWLHGRQQRYEAGVALGERALEIARHVLGEPHQVTLHAKANLGWLYTGQGRYDEAAPLLTRSLDLAKRHLGENHAVTVCCALKLGGLYRKQGKYDDHDTLLIELLETCRRSFGEDSVLTGYTKYGLDVRRNQLAALAEEQNASGDREGAAVTLTRLEEIRQALEGDSEKSIESRE